MSSQASAHVFFENSAADCVKNLPGDIAALPVFVEVSFSPDDENVVAVIRDQTGTSLSKRVMTKTQISLLAH